MSTSYTPGAKTRSKEIIARSPTSEGAPGSVNLPTRSDETTQPTANLGTTSLCAEPPYGRVLAAVSKFGVIVTVITRETGRQKLDMDAYDGFGTAGEQWRACTRLWGQKNT